jgi:thiol-disulfide isomerase/thioredoxin
VLGIWIILAAVVVALAFGGYRALTDGRFRGTRRIDGADDRVERGVDDGVSEEARMPEVTSQPAESDLSTTWAELADAAKGVTPGERATLVQFSSAFCAPCRATRRILSDVADAVPGVVHLEIDAEHHLEVVRRLHVLRTPTTLILDSSGREIARAAGAPRKEQVLSALPQGS